MAGKQPRPRRVKKADRILHREAAEAEVRCDYATGPFDRVSNEMDRKWGVDRLPDLVSVETAEKFGAAMHKLNTALASQDPEEVKLRVGVCIRGLQAMDREAEAAGMPQASPDYFEAEVDGFKFAIMREGRDWQVHHEARPDLRFFSMQEVGVALKALRIDNPIFAEVKKHFPQAQIESIAERAAPKHREDPIPF